ncbi:MAG TPA: hypothetical protein P5181_09480 [Dermatophilaceae bacterium]|nr:hypothetical protein [Dermatophilaceae bacterium]
MDSLATLIEADRKKRPPVHAIVAAEELPEAGVPEGIDILKRWVCRTESSFVSMALGALMLAPRELLQDEAFLDDVRGVLLSERLTGQHVRAASLLGVISRWPDPALGHAMQHDESAVVRGEAFRAALMLAGVPYASAREQAGRVELGGVRATPALVEEIARGM